jgi:hypothetical protein
MARPTKHAYRYKYVGRTSKLTPEVVKKLEEAASIDASVSQTCYYAGISRKTYYEWMKNNPELSDRLDDLRERRPLQANRNITAAIEAGDLAISKWELEKKEPEKYGDKIKIEHSGSIMSGDVAHPEDELLRIEYKEKLKANIRKRAEEKAKLEKGA